MSSRAIAKASGTATIVVVTVASRPISEGVGDTGTIEASR